MTEQDFAKIRFKTVMSLAAEHEHMISYVSVDREPRIGICVHTPVRKDGSFGKAVPHYRFLGKVYKNKASLLEAMTEHEQSITDKFKRQ